jgi:hypothetical protein
MQQAPLSRHLAALIVLGSTAWLTPAAAWQASAYYPSSFDPYLPTPQQALRLHAEPDGVFATLRRAHGDALYRGWTGIPAVQRASPPSHAANEGSGSAELELH